eukprot:1160581-Rhodomonas_salina.3
MFFSNSTCILLPSALLPSTLSILLSSTLLRSPCSLLFPPRAPFRPPPPSLPPPVLSPLPPSSSPLPSSSSLLRAASSGLARVPQHLRAARNRWMRAVPLSLPPALPPSLRLSRSPDARAHSASALAQPQYHGARGRSSRSLFPHRQASSSITCGSSEKATCCGAHLICHKTPQRHRTLSPFSRAACAASLHWCSHQPSRTLLHALPTAQLCLSPSSCHLSLQRCVPPASAAALRECDIRGQRGRSGRSADRFDLEGGVGGEEELLLVLEVGAFDEVHMPAAH